MPGMSLSHLWWCSSERTSAHGWVSQSCWVSKNYSIPCMWSSRQENLTYSNICQKSGSPWGKSIGEWTGLNSRSDSAFSCRIFLDKWLCGTSQFHNGKRSHFDFYIYIINFERKIIRLLDLTYRDNKIKVPICSKLKSSIMTELTLMMNLFFLMEHSDSWASHETHCVEATQCHWTGRWEQRLCLVEGGWKASEVDL